MHQALLYPEVLLDIFTHVNDILDPSYAEKLLARKSFAALATTCRAFHEPAMDSLWAEIDRLEPLLGCVTRLHPLIYYSDRIWDDSQWAEGIEPLSADEARQFLRHSTRIRSLEVLSHRLFLLLSVIPVEAYVFPRLRSLTLSTEYLGLFMSHTLRRRYLVTVNEDLQSIMTRCAALEHLSVNTSDDSIADESTADELSLLSKSVCLCKRLVTLCCPLLDWTAWKHLSNLPTLLRVEVGDTNSDSELPWPLGRDIVNFSPFLNVTALSFLMHSAAYVITFMQHSQFPSLKEFKMDVDFLYSSEPEQLFRALSQCNTRRTLESVIICSFDPGSQDAPDNYLSAIPHFLCFTQLRTLELAVFDSCIYLDNDILLEAMSTWPHLRNLEIKDSRLRPSPVTFRGLFTALRLCPQLLELRISIDTANIDIDPNTEPIQYNSLRILELDPSEFVIANPEALARIILAWLPCVDRVSASAFARNWDKVNMHLKSLKDSALHVAGASSNN